MLYLIPSEAKVSSIIEAGNTFWNGNPRDELNWLSRTWTRLDGLSNLDLLKNPQTPSPIKLLRFSSRTAIALNERGIRLRHHFCQLPEHLNFVFEFTAHEVREYYCKEDDIYSTS